MCPEPFEYAEMKLDGFIIKNPSEESKGIIYLGDFITTGKIADLSEKYDFTIFDDKDIIDICDKISCRFYGHVSGSFRKLAFWHGPFEEFVYIEYLSDYEFITSSSNLPINRKWVWEIPIERWGKMKFGITCKGRIFSCLINIQSCSFIRLEFTCPETLKSS